MNATKGTTAPVITGGGDSCALRAQSMYAYLDGAGLKPSMVALGEGPHRRWAVRVPAEQMDRHVLHGVLELALQHDAEVWLSRGILRLSPREQTGVAS